jgi:5-methylcytosine-specific restriction endonuclease McrA
MITPKTPKPAPAESRQAYERVKTRSFGLCELCGAKRATEVHHRLHRSHGGPDTVTNLLHVCGWGNTSGCHGAAHTDSNRYANGWAVRTGYDPGLMPVLYRGALMILTEDGGLF